MSSSNADSHNQRIGADLRRLRESAGYTTEDAAEALARSAGKPVQPYTVNRMENGKRPITVDEVLTLTNLYGSATARQVLFGEDDEMSAMSIELHRRERDLEDLEDRISQLVRDHMDLQVAMYSLADNIRARREGVTRGDLSHVLADSDTPVPKVAADNLQVLVDIITGEWSKKHGQTEA